MKRRHLQALHELGKIRGIWQTEIGDAYMVNQNYLPQYYFDNAIWALGHGWDDRDKYVSMIYHWEGTEPFRLTARDGTYNPSGRSLVTLRATLPGFLAPFDHAITASAGLTAGSAVLRRQDRLPSRRQARRARDYRR